MIFLGMARKFNPKKLSRLMKNKRKKLGISQDKLSWESGVSEAGIQKLEYGIIKNPGIRTLIKIANILKMDIKEFIEEVCD